MQLVEISGLPNSAPAIHAANMLFLSQTHEAMNFLAGKARDSKFWGGIYEDFNVMVYYMHRVDVIPKSAALQRLCEENPDRYYEVASALKEPYVKKAYEKMCDLQKNISTALKVATEEEEEELVHNLGTFWKLIESQKKVYNAFFKCSQKIEKEVSSSHRSDTAAGAVIFAISCLFSRRAMETAVAINVVLQLFNIARVFLASKYTDPDHFKAEQANQALVR